MNFPTSPGTTSYSPERVMSNNNTQKQLKIGSGITSMFNQNSSRREGVSRRYKGMQAVRGSMPAMGETTASIDLTNRSMA